MINEGDDFQRRHRRHHAEPLPRNRSIYEWTALVFVSLSALAGPWLFGAVRLWSVAPLMLFLFTGLAMTALRPVIFPAVRSIQFPLGMTLVLGFVLYATVLMFFAAVPYEARIEVLRLASYAGALWVWTELASHKSRWRWLIGALLLSATVMAWYALIQHTRGSRMVMFLERPPQYEMRASGAYMCPNHFANYIEIALPICLALVACTSAGTIMRLLAGYGLIVLLPALYLTVSRSGYIGAFVGLSVTASFMALRKGSRQFLLAVLLAATAGVIVVLALWNLSPMAHERIAQALQGDIRIQLWKDTWNMIADKPWFGHGPGSYRWVYPHFWHNMTMYLDPQYAHNDYLHAMAEYGIVGAGFILVTAFFMMSRLKTLGVEADRRKDGLLVAGLMGSLAACMAHAAFDYTFQIYANNHLLIMLIGIVTAGLYTAGELEGRELQGNRRLLAGGGVALAVLLFLATLQVFLSYGFNFFGEEARTAFKTEEARRAYQTSMRIDPGNWRPYLGLAHLLRVQSFWNLDPDAKRELAGKARQNYEQVIKKNPWDMEAVYGLSKVYAASGDGEKALALCKDIVQRVPYQRFYWSELGLQLRQMGRYQEALDVFRKAQRMGTSELIEINIEFLQDKIAETAKK